MYDELVFYLEACESGSMFPDLTSDSDIYAMTASNAYLSSYATYCGFDARVEGTFIGSCLGDLFSVNWMEDTDAANISTETLQTQQTTVISKTSASPVQTFGDFSFLDEAIGDFEGDLDNISQFEQDVKDFFNENKHGRKIKKFAERVHEKKENVKEFIKEKRGKREFKHIDQRDTKLVDLFEQYRRSGHEIHLADLQAMLAHRAKADKFFANIMPGFNME